MALKHGLSVITMEINIQGATDTDMEAKEHDLIETLVETDLYFSSRGALGTEAVLRIKANAATLDSYKSVFYGVLDELDARDVLGAIIKAHRLEGLRLTLYCEPYWHPLASTQLANATVIYNHNDAALGGVHAAHINYIQIAAASILGDLDGPTRLLVEFEAATVASNTKLVKVVRRTRGTPANLAYWLEGENGALNNWAAGGAGSDNTCSNTDRISDAAAAAGDVIFTVAAPSTDDYGRFGVYARLWAGDIVNTRFRISSYFAASGWMYNKWYWLKAASKWQLLYLGDVFWDPSLRTGVDISTLVLKLEYQKDAAGDIARCDYVWLAPVDESMIEITVPSFLVTCAVGEFFASSDVDKFEYTALENATPDLLVPGVRHGELRLRPGVINRLYFYMDSYDGASNLSEVDNATPNAPLTMKVTIDYLPQFVSPLE